MPTDREPPEEHLGDERYYERSGERAVRGFDARLLAEPLNTLPQRPPIVFSASHTVAEAMAAMQQQRRGSVLVTEDGTQQTRLIGIFTDRDALLRVIGHGRNPAQLPLSEVMTPEPESLPGDATVAWVLNRMAFSGFRHVPVVDADGSPLFVISVRDVVQFLAEYFPREVLNLPPEFGGPPPRKREGA
ncbi:MAG: CBS domain-containing protein [Deltaproteobacteria bacterium]|nr:MAG: CBS domain-containing protein [Deltaproteobacteria bacterium]